MEVFSAVLLCSGLTKESYKVQLGSGYYIANFLYKTRLIDIYFKLRRNQYIKKSAQYLFEIFSNIKVKEYIIRKFNTHEKKKIFDYYKQNNVKLQKYFSLDKLKNYGYIE